MYTLVCAATDAISLVCAAVILLFIYSLYADPQMYNSMFCSLTTEHAGYAMCRIMNN